jgi:prolyl-tRNA synthetase
MHIAEKAEAAFREAGLDVLVDDRDARPGVKFADAELVGVPFRLTIGTRNLEKGQLEFTPRLTGDTEMLTVDDGIEAALDSVLNTK